MGLLTDLFIGMLLFVAQHMNRSIRVTEHMNRRRITNEAMAEALDVSVRTISGWRNTQAPSLQLRDITAICICLHLEPELSDDLIAKTGLRPTCTEEHTVYRILLRTVYPYEPAKCNEILIQAGFALALFAAAMLVSKQKRIA